MQRSFLYEKQTKKTKQIAHFFHAGSHVVFDAWYDLLQKLSGRSVNPGLQMFGQSISGNVDMDGNGYAGTVRTYETKAWQIFFFLETSNQETKMKTSNRNGWDY